jgi:Flp pilus assembly protein TadD
VKDLAFLLAAIAMTAARGSAAAPAAITIDYPAEGSIFPPDIAAPTFLWRDAAEDATVWLIDVSFADGAAAIRVQARGERMRVGPIDPRCISPTNQPPALTPQQAAARTWRPEGSAWNVIKKHSVDRPAIVVITGFRDKGLRQPVSRGQVAIQTSRDPVGAPIFYRDVPLMPSELEKGVIKPLAPAALPLIAWRLRNVGETGSRLLMESLPTCANCHSFSRDGGTLGLDLDGPQNDKGLYAIVPIRPQTSISSQEVVAWSGFRGTLGSQLRVGFMSQVSPDGQYVVTTIKPPGTDGRELYYVANFKDYRFLQVFYPTRGILVWYNRRTRTLLPLPGADDPQYVQTNAVWSPDGKYLVFARARAKDPYAEGVEAAEYANDPNETPIQYDLYRIPFNAGRGGRAEPIAGASRNGMSNSFPKVSPDGRWIVFVQARNGLLMRPDSQLYIVPAGPGGHPGEARRMRANTSLMNSWHSFSPNGRWLVFSSKSRSPYTQMFLTHLDENGRDSPAVLIENATAANRAVNIPEFVNIPLDALSKIEVPAVEFYRRVDRAWELTGKGRNNEAIAEWKRALELDPGDARAHTNLGVALFRAGKPDEAIDHYQQALAANPDYAEAHNDLGIVLARTGRFEEALVHYRRALEIGPESAEVHTNLGVALAGKGAIDEAIAQYRAALAINPDYPEVHSNLGAALASTGQVDEAITHLEKFLAANPNSADAHYNLGIAFSLAGRAKEASEEFENAAALTGGAGAAERRQPVSKR